MKNFTRFYLPCPLTTLKELQIAESHMWILEEASIEASCNCIKARRGHFITGTYLIMEVAAFNKGACPGLPLDETIKKPGDLVSNFAFDSLLARYDTENPGTSFQGWPEYKNQTLGNAAG
ncbi:hypothetical protein FQN60_006158 [Etheostoma spectabile]|uniref:Uncharacterized protein n=1 Tax=Etheostoma spectabile TaxID=54343 RepID=A0A5J5CLB3_9PERO|nr:hypothetical protein FQN60_006158 [Etheostoma spectabile]